jgi:hypothetical protein
MFKMKLNQIQPSQLYICIDKLAAVKENWESTEPIPIKNLNGNIIFTDGHTRAFYAHQQGFDEIEVYWDEDELDWEAYQICVDWCKDAGIFTIADLENRIVNQQDYKKLWYDRCEKMQEELEEERLY